MSLNVSASNELSFSKFYSFILIVFIFVLHLNLGFAQDSNIPSLVYGDNVDAVLRQTESEVEFKFEGKANDIIVIEASVGLDNVLSGFYPEIVLFNERGSQVFTTENNETLENLDMYSAMLPVEIPADGTYSIVVKPGAFSTLMDDAGFTLRLLKPEILELDEPVEASVRTDFPSYHVIIADTQFSVDYMRLSGSFYPSVSVGRILGGSLESMGVLYGESLVGGSLILEPNRNTIHLVKVTTSPYDLGNIFSVNESEYTVILRR